MALCIVDGNYCVCRCVYSSGSDLTSSTGLKTGAVYKFLKTLWTIRDLGDPIVVFDGGRSQRRMELYPAYKERPKSLNENTDEKDPTQELLTYTYETLEKLLPNMGIPTVRIIGQEGDDVMYRLTEILAKKGADCYVITDDADLMQVVNLGARVYRPMKNEYVTPVNFVDKMGFTPDLFALYKAMIGDKSDNINAIYGLGPVKATKILNEIAAQLTVSHSCEEEIRVLLEWSENQKGKLSQSIAEGINVIRRNIFLVDLRYIDLPREEVVRAYAQSLQEAKINVDYVVKMFRAMDIVTLGNWVSHIVKKARTTE